MIYNAYDVTLDGYQVDSDQAAVEWARGFVFCECEAQEQSIGHARYIDSVDGIGVYYDYAADYYFFTDETED